MTATVSLLRVGRPDLPCTSGTRPGRLGGPECGATPTLGFPEGPRCANHYPAAYVRMEAEKARRPNTTREAA